MGMLTRHSLIAFLLAGAAGLVPAQAAAPSATSLTAREGTALNGELALSFMTSLGTHAANTDARPSWNAVQAQALELSRAQHNGQPEILRFCEPQLKVCNTGVVWRASNGTKLFLRQAEDMSGKPLEREVCEINAFGDVRVCIDWDTNKTSRDMKDRKGHWYKVADQ
jgi:hypothetical protein